MKRYGALRERTLQERYGTLWKRYWSWTVMEPLRSIIERYRSVTEHCKALWKRCRSVMGCCRALRNIRERCGTLQNVLEALHIVTEPLRKISILPII